MCDTTAPHTFLELLNDPLREILEQCTGKTRQIWLLSTLGEAKVVLAVRQGVSPKSARFLEVLGEVMVVGVNGIIADEDPQAEEGGSVEVFPFAVRPPAEVS